MNVTVIYNPVAGRGRHGTTSEHIRELFRRHGVDAQVLVSRYPGHPRELAQNVRPGTLLVAMGGDGTVQQVASVCAERGLCLGIIPAGSGDDLAFALGIDRNDLEGAVRRITGGEPHPIDTGTCNGRRFINAAGSGFDAEVALAALAAPPVFRESSAYLYGIVTSLRRLAAAPVTVSIDGELAFAGSSLLVSVQNGPRTGGAFRFSPASRVDDGVFDVLIAGNVSRLQTLSVLPRLLDGSHLRHPKVQLLQARESVQIAWAQPRPAHLEGELLEPVKEYDVRLFPASLRVVV